MNTNLTHKTLTEFAPTLIDRIQSVIQSNNESELRIVSETFSDLQMFIHSYGQYAHFNLRIQNPIDYIKPTTLGLPTHLSGFEHPKINKFIYDFNDIIPAINLQVTDFNREFYDSSANEVIYQNRVKIKFE